MQADCFIVLGHFGICAKAGQDFAHFLDPLLQRQLGQVRAEGSGKAFAGDLNDLGTAGRGKVVVEGVENLGEDGRMGFGEEFFGRGGELIELVRAAGAGRWPEMRTKPSRLRARSCARTALSVEAQPLRQIHNAAISPTE